MSKKLYIFPLSDVHIGSKESDITFLHKWRKEFEKAPKNKIIYLLGDLIDFPRASLDAYGVMMTTNDAVERIVDLLEPYKDYIRYAVSGNHELRSMREHNFDVTGTIASRLGARYSKNDFLDRLSVDGQDFVVYGKHGTRTSKNSMLAMNNFVRDMADIEANLYLQGHNHYGDFQSRYRRGLDGGTRKYYCFTGHFLKYGGYARDKGLPQSQPCFTRLTVDRNLHIDGKIYYKDEMI